MKGQWTIIVGLVFALIIALFATFNTARVPVNYLFGKAYWPLILIILGSALLGVLISACFSAFRLFKQGRMIQALRNELLQKEQQLNAQNTHYKHVEHE